MSPHGLRSVVAYCQVCQGHGVVMLEAHFVAECELPTPLPVVCPHCSQSQSWPVHHYHRRAS